MRRFIVLSALLALGAGIGQAAEPVTISEFMAANGNVLQDEDGIFSDWIEIRNTGTNTVNMGGWYLTDSAGDLTKWSFPSTNLPVGGHLIVFASGKDRRIAGAPLHANFNLSAAGEYLALVKPDGTTKASEYAPTYPPQSVNVSYGAGILASNFTVVSSNAAIRYRIPSDGTDGTNWLYPGFDDSSWTDGTNGVGYGATNAFTADYGSAISSTAPLVHYRFRETSGTVATNSGSGTGMNGTFNSATLGTIGPRPPTHPGFEANNTAVTLNGSSGFVAGPNGFFNNRNAFTVGGWVNPAATPGTRIGLFGQNDCVEFGFISGFTIELWTPGGGSVQGNYGFGANAWHHIVGVGDGANLRIYVDGVQVAVGGTATASYGSSAFNFNIGGGGVQDGTGNFFNGQIDEVVAYQRALSAAEVLALYRAGTNAGGVTAASFVRTDVSGVMSNVNSSAYIRIPFNLDDLSKVDGLTLRVRHDDGFAAYINGTPVAVMNAPGSLAFNSTATGEHAPNLLDSFTFGTNGLRQGTNILAIQGLNIAANDPDFLIAAELITTRLSDEATGFYFTVPTPGQPNGNGVLNPGPSILNPAHTPNSPLDNQDLVVTARVSPTFNAISNVVLRYRVMFGAEIEVQMFDDGLHGDGGTNDGVYGVSIPESAYTNSQMVRWYFRATDMVGNVSRWPLYANPLEGAQYLGTVVNPHYVTSKVPVVHLYAEPTVLGPPPTGGSAGADSQAGGYVSVFYDGEFYDNVRMELRGNSTAGYLKKSHRLDFSREHPFRHKDGYPRIRKTSFTADYPDQTYLRQLLTFKLATEFGAPAPFYYPMRLQLNGQFYQLANHNDVQTDEFLERIGYDPNGALYNAAGLIVRAKTSTGGFDKKTRKWDTTDADYFNLTDSIVETLNGGQRRTNGYELLDLPEVINYMVVARFVHENDDVWANMSVYNDNDGDKLWRILPFDMNLSWGAMFSEGFTGVQATNDTHKSHPLYGGTNVRAVSNTSFFNRLYDIIFNTPEFRQMYLRRLRTFLDTYIKPPGTATNSTELEQFILSSRDLIAEEARLDRIMWGWPGNGGQSNFDPPAGNPAFGTAARTNAASVNLSNAVNDLLVQFFHARRSHFYERHSITNTRAPLFSESINPAGGTVAGIPAAQASNLVVYVGTMDFKPASNNQGHEYIQLTNPNPVAVDISGWRLDGGVDFTFRPGTVILPTNVLYVTANRNVFKTRTTAPRTNQALFVIGNYQGSLDARGEIVRLYDDANRLVHTNGYVPNPSLAQQYLRITEIMYAPAPGGTFAQEDYEYVELKNIGAVDVSLVGVHFTNGITFTFTAGGAITSLAPGETIVLVKNPSAFIARYGAVATIAGVYTGSLDNSGERIKLNDSFGEQVLDFEYNNSWYPLTDGVGFSLVIVDETAPWDTWSAKASWRASGIMFGSPGNADPAPGTFVPVVVNEVLASSVSPAVDYIELWNPTTNSADVSHWWISDDFTTPRKFRIPAATVIPAGGYLVFTEAAFNVGGTNFAFSQAGDEAYLFSGDASGNLTGYYQGFDFGASDPGVAFGIHVPSDGDVQFVAQAANTPDAANALPRVGPLVISELMYHPPDLLSGTNIVDDSLTEFIELHNTSGSPVPLSPDGTNYWRLTDAVTFTFGTNVIQPGGYLVVVSFDPATDAAALAAFRAHYGIDNTVEIVGPWVGELNNGDDSVKLRRPFTAGTNTTWPLIEEVHYHDDMPWDPVADGTGASLHRFVATDFANDPTNFIAAVPTPGSGFTPGTPPIITQHPSNAAVFVAGSSVINSPYVVGTTNFTVAVSGAGVRYQWRFNGSSIVGATNATLTLTNIQFSNAGIYNLVAYNDGGSVVSSNATLAVYAPAAIQIHPQSQTVSPGATVNLSVSAVGVGTLLYQWRRDGTNITDATNSTYTILNANPSINGNYYCVVQDELSTIISSNAFIFAPPLYFSVHPTNQNVLPGTNVTLIANAVGYGQVTYQWRFEGVDIPGATNASHSFTNANLTNHHGNFSCVAQDNYSTATTSNALIYVLVRPGIVQHVQHVFTLQGGTTVFSLVATGAPPLGYRWVRDGIGYATTSIPVLVITNVQATSRMRVIVTNLALPSGVLSPGPTAGQNVTNFVTADLDRDGIGDPWEITYFGTNATNNAGNALLDSDGDGMNNRDEYIANTNPTNALSLLNILFSATNAQQLEFVAQSNVSYSVQWRTNLSGPGWTNLTSILASPQVRTISVEAATAPGNGERYFRIVTPLVP